jgi:hypothetical protein
MTRIKFIFFCSRSLFKDRYLLYNKNICNGIYDALAAIHEQLMEGKDLGV